MNLKSCKLLMLVAGIAMFSGCLPAEDGGGVVEVKTVEEFNSYFENPKEYPNLFVDFFAHWCPPCKKLLPVLDELEGEYPVKFVKINVDNAELAPLKEKFGVRGIPSLHLIKGGDFDNRKRMVGYAGKADLEKEIEDFFGVKKVSK